MNRLVVLDIDGVLADFEGKIVRALTLLFGEEGGVNRNMFSLEDRFADFPYLLKQAKEFTADPNFYYDLRQVPGAFSFVSELVDNGFSIIFFSSRSEYMTSVTRRWLHKNFKGYFERSLGLFCGITDKAHFLKDLDQSIEFVVEDNPEQIRKMREDHIPAIVWGQPWNEGIFPRLYLRSDGELMLWPAADIEAQPFWVEEGV